MEPKLSAQQFCLIQTIFSSPKEPLITCSSCCIPVSESEVSGDALQGFICDWCSTFWENIIQDKNSGEPIFIIGGQVYQMGEEPDEGASYWLGYGGREWHIRSQGELIITHNLWYRGKVPSIFRSDLPDNAVFESVSHSNDDLLQ